MAYTGGAEVSILTTHSGVMECEGIQASILFLPIPVQADQHALHKGHHHHYHHPHHHHPHNHHHPRTKDARLPHPVAEAKATFTRKTQSGATFWSVSGLVPRLPKPDKMQVTVCINRQYFASPKEVLCYDPHGWRITELIPRCGLGRASTPLRITGEGFVPTGKLKVRFTQPSTGAMEEVAAAIGLRQMLDVRVIQVLVGRYKCHTLLQQRAAQFLACASSVQRF